jgi:hypothetical protein
MGRPVGKESGGSGLSVESITTGPAVQSQPAADADNTPMCGRFNLDENPRALARYFALADVLQLAPRYNVAPSQWAGVVGLKPGGAAREHPPAAFTSRPPD